MLVRSISPRPAWGSAPLELKPSLHAQALSAEQSFLDHGHLSSEGHADGAIPIPATARSPIDSAALCQLLRAAARNISLNLALVRWRRAAQSSTPREVERPFEVKASAVALRQLLGGGGAQDRE